MKNLNVHMVLEDTYLGTIFDKLSSDKVLTRKKVQYYLKKGDISYFEYDILYNYDKTIFNWYELKFFKYSHRYYKNIWSLSRLFSLVGDFRLLIKEKYNVTYLISSYIKYKDFLNIDSDRLKKCVIKLYYYWKAYERRKNKEGDVTCTIRYPQNVELQEKKSTIEKINQYSDIEFPISRYVSKGFKDVICIWNKLWSGLQNYIKSVDWLYMECDVDHPIPFSFKPSIFIIEEYVYIWHFNNKFSHENHYVLII